MSVTEKNFGKNQKTIKRDCYSVSERLIDCLEYVPFKNTLIRGEDISWHLIDDVLQLFITYKFTTKTDVPFENSMEDLEETTISSK